MSAHAKSILAALAAVVIAGIQSWQVVTVGGFRPVDLLPVATAVVGALLTFVVPNVPELPWAKTVVHGAAAVLTALSTLVGSHPAGVTVANLGVCALFSLLVWYTPELAPALGRAAPVDARDLLAALADVPVSPAAVQQLTQPITAADLPAFDASLAEISATVPAADVTATPTT